VTVSRSGHFVAFYTSTRNVVSAPIPTTTMRSLPRGTEQVALIFGLAHDLEISTIRRLSPQFEREQMLIRAELTELPQAYNATKWPERERHGRIAGRTARDSQALARYWHGLRLAQCEQD